VVATAIPFLDSLVDSYLTFFCLVPYEFAVSGNFAYEYYNTYLGQTAIIGVMTSQVATVIEPRATFHPVDSQYHRVDENQSGVFVSNASNSYSDTNIGSFLLDGIFEIHPEDLSLLSLSPRVSVPTSIEMMSLGSSDDSENSS
jgi:hypothetical protein